MAIIGDALRQAFMPKHEYDTLRDEEKAWGRLQKPVIMALVTIIWITVVVSTFTSLKIVFPSKDGDRPMCRRDLDRRIMAIPVNASRDSDLFPGAFYLTEEEAADYYWMVVFLPSVIVFFASIGYLFAGIAVAYSAPTRHGCLRVVENNYCASKRGGVRCLAILNTVFAVVFGLLALFLGSSLLTLGSDCSLPLFWFYEISTWGLVLLYGGTAFFLRRKAAVILDEASFSGRNLGLEMLEAPPQHVTMREMERRLNEGFKTWMGSGLLSSDEEDEPDNYLEVHPIRTNSS
eukprot:TRINITY_DN3338_c0_g2_i1.p1 TRINITY_DN3338_c0_g2~~TRINITY_DN3338_c0_g2_i1.p1  ORF type:complete len:290 (+),score=40.81 TRINITY_DN3338_c0_g2_i1:404-1273(+)